MTANNTATQTLLAAKGSETAQVLRDMAFILRATRLVKADVLRAAARPNRSAAPVVDRTLVALGV